MEYATGVQSFRPYFRRHPDNPILTTIDWPYPANSVFNAGATTVGGETLLLARVEDHRGISHLTAARSRDGVAGWKIDPAPSLMPDPGRYPEELYGIEDPRIVLLEESRKWVIAYTAYSHGGPLVALACTTDFKNYERLGPVMPPEDKDAALFPRKFDGRWAMIHRPSTAFFAGRVHMWISFSPDLKHWGDHKILLRSREGGWWDANKIGLSAPPMETPEGWLILYHGVRQTPAGSLYRLGLALLDLENPLKVRRRSNEWIFAPMEPYERTGDVGDVVFPCGWIHDKEKGIIRMYYGCADTSIGLATADFKELLDYILYCCPEPRDLPSSR
ncbi:MAG: glycosidase [Syntrophales bacterium]